MEKLLTIQDVMKILGISRTTLWKIMKRGELRSRPVGERGVRFRQEDIEEYLEEDSMRIRLKDLQRRIDILDARIQERQDSIDSSDSIVLQDVSRLYIDIGRKLELEQLLENRGFIT